MWMVSDGMLRENDLLYAIYLGKSSDAMKQTLAIPLLNVLFFHRKVIYE